MVPHSRILESIELVQASGNILEFVKRSVGKRKKTYPEKWIFQGNNLSPLSFAIFMIPLTNILRKAKARCTLEGGEKTNHLLFMDDLKLYGKSENEVKELLCMVEVFSQDIGVEFGIKSVV